MFQVTKKPTVQVMVEVETDLNAEYIARLLASMMHQYVCDKHIPSNFANYLVGQIVDPRLIQDSVWHDPKSASILNGTVATYHGNYDPIVGEGFGVPNVPIGVDVNDQGIAIRLGPQSPPDDELAPIASSIWIERRTDRWSVNIAGQQDGDIDVAVYILDDGRIEISQCTCDPAALITFVDMPLPSLPWDQVKYKVGLPTSLPIS